MFLEEKTSEVSEFSNLLYTQNRKLRNMGKCCFTSNLNNRWKNDKKLTGTKTCSFTSNFDRGCNLRLRNDKNELKQKLKGQDMLLEEKKEISRDFRVFDFAPHPKLKTRKSRKLFF